MVYLLFALLLWIIIVSIPRAGWSKRPHASRVRVSVAHLSQKSFFFFFFFFYPLFSSSFHSLYLIFQGKLWRVEDEKKVHPAAAGVLYDLVWGPSTLLKFIGFSPFCILNASHNLTAFLAILYMKQQSSLICYAGCTQSRQHTHKKKTHRKFWGWRQSRAPKTLFHMTREQSSFIGFHFDCTWMTLDVASIPSTPQSAIL